MNRAASAQCVTLAKTPDKEHGAQKIRSGKARVRKIFFHVSLLLAAIIAMSTNAGEITGQLAVSVTIVASCRMSLDTTMLSFGEIAQDAGSADASAEVGVRCSRNQPYAITFDNGQHAVGAQRHMGNGNATVAYRLYSDAARSQPLAASDGLRGVGSGGDQAIPVYARLQLARNTPTGRYTDVVRMTVTW